MGVVSDGVNLYWRGLVSKLLTKGWGCNKWVCRLKVEERVEQLKIHLYRFNS